MSFDPIVLIKNGGVGVLPTDTVYGLVASARHPSTLIRVVDDAVEVLRPGAVNINEAREIVK